MSDPFLKDRRIMQQLGRFGPASGLNINEDIPNQAGFRLRVKLYNATPQGGETVNAVVVKDPATHCHSLQREENSQPISISNVIGWLPHEKSK